MDRKQNDEREYLLTTSHFFWVSQGTIRSLVTKDSTLNKAEEKECRVFTKDKKHGIYFEFANFGPPKADFKCHLWKYLIMCIPKKSDSGFHRSMTSLTIRKAFSKFLFYKIFGSQIITTLCFHGGRDKEIDYIA